VGSVGFLSGLRRNLHLPSGDPGGMVLVTQTREEAMALLQRRDLRHTLRRFAREPLFTAVTLLTLGLGIGATSAVYSVVDGVLLEPLPYDHPEELVSVNHSAPGLGVDRIPNSRSSQVVYQELSRSFQSMALHSGASVTLTEAGEPARLVARRISPSLFDVLRVQPAVGRPFSEEEGRPGGPPVAIVSHGLWVERFGSDPALVGRSIVLDGRSCEVVGVMPADFEFPSDDVDLWIPLPVDPTETSFRGFNEEGIARLAPGVTPDAAEGDVQSLIPRLTERYADITPALLDQMGLKARVRPYLDDVVGDVRTALWVLLGTVGFVLLIACANVANLMLVRAEGRRREVAVRSAIGAGQKDLMAQHLVESVTLAAGGAILGLGLAWLGLGLLRNLGAETLPRLDQVGLDGSVLLLTILLTVLAAVVFALIPVLRHRSLQPAQELRDGTRASTRGRKGVLARELLVAGQVALALVLLVGSGLMVRSFAALSRVDPGFEAEDLLTFRVSLPSSQYRSPQEVATFHQEFLDRLRALPGVRAAGAVSVLPVGSMSGINGFYPVQDPPSADEMAPAMETRGATPGYFEALGIPVLLGRGPTWGDGADGRNVVMVSRKALDLLFGGSLGTGPDLLSRTLGAEIVEGISATEDPSPSAIVGVVGDVHNASLVDEPMGTIYYAPLQAGDLDRSWLTRSMSYAVRTSGDPLALAPAVRTVLGEIDPHLPLSAIQTMESRLADSHARTTFTLTMLAIAALMGLILGAVGLYGVISYVTGRRTREIGLRMALGAERSEVRGMVIRRGMLVTSLGILGGLAAGWALSRWLQSLLYGVQPNDPLTYVSVTAVLLAVAFLATWIPAARASRVDAMEALRSE